MRARRSSRSASGVSIVNGRIAVASADVAVVTAMWLLTLVAMAQTDRGRYAHTPTECRSRESPARRGLRQSGHTTVHPAKRKRPSAAPGEAANSGYRASPCADRRRAQGSARARRADRREPRARGDRPEIDIQAAQHLVRAQNVGVVEPRGEHAERDR